MPDTKDETLDVMKRGINRTIESTASELELITTRLNNHFQGLDADKLPEYQKALDAIHAYQKSLVKHFTKKYKES